MHLSLEETVAALGAAVAALDASSLSGADAAAQHALFAQAERLAVAGRTVCASVIDRTGVFREAGHRSAAHFVAAATGTTVASGAATVATSRALGSLPAMRGALVSGALSVQQAAAVALGATADPSAEASLLAVASVSSVRDLRQRSLMVRAAAAGGESRLEAIRATRFLRMWDDEDGALRLEGRLAPDAGAYVRAVLEARAAELSRDGKRAGVRVSGEHARADALVSVVTGEAAPKAVVHVHVDASAYERGSLVPGERCDIGGMPITVATARKIATDGWVKVIEHDGVDVRRVAHLGRTIPAHVRSAVDALWPKCGITACPNSQRLDYDHRTPLSEGGETSVHNVWRLCTDRCHYLKTHHGWVPVERQEGVWELLPPTRGP